MSNTTEKDQLNDRARLADVEVPRGHGGETHQTADDSTPTLTTRQGVAVSDNQNALRIGARGPTALEDFHFREKLFHFDHERIPERVVHARGFGAHGYFETYESLADLTCADLFQRAGEKTPAFVRFSTVAGNKGSADLARDVRGFAVKLYTKAGNWDIVGNNIPVFFIQDAIKFPDLIHAVKQEPDRGFPQAQTAHDNFWDFISLTPESMHMVMWIMSDRTIPRSFRFMEGFGVHTFRLINEAGKSKFVKFHWKPKFGLQSVLWDEAVKLNGADPDFHRRDLWDAIQAGQPPEWELGLQVFDEDFAEQFEFDVLDATKLIPEEDVPVRLVGRLVLDRCVDNFFAETEQVAFCTQNIVPGIDFSNDPLLQGRNFSYLDTQLKRLGSANFSDIPVNAPQCGFHTFQRDGHMTTIVPRGRANYEPNSWSGDAAGPREAAGGGFVSFPETVHGDKQRRRPETFADHYSQARQFYVSQTAVERSHIAAALVFELAKVERVEIRSRMVAHLLNIDEDLAQQVADGLRLPELPPAADVARVVRTDLAPSPALSIIKNGPDSFAGRKVGVLVTDGTDADLLGELKRVIEAEGATCEIVAEHVGGVTLDDGALQVAAEQLAGAPSVLYDAVALLPAAAAADALCRDSNALAFVTDALNHYKPIGYVEAAVGLLRMCSGRGDSSSAGVVRLDSAAGSADGANEFIGQCRRLRCWDRGQDA